MDEIYSVSQETANLNIQETRNTSPQNTTPATPSKPRVNRIRGPMAQDITAKFSEAASALKTGELVKDEYFTLFESVGALEIMDPKMDSGYLAPGETLEDDYDVLRELLPEEVIGIMDQLLCYEMAWHMGYSLAQSLFTSLYIDRLLWPEPKTLDQARFDRDNPSKGENGLLHLVLRAFSLGLIKTCGCVHQRVSTEHYYEEEDLVLTLYNRNMLSNFEVADISNLLNKAKDFIESDELGLSATIKHALVMRLQLRIQLLAAVNANNSSDRERARDWEACIGLLPYLKETTALGKSVESSFSPKLQRKLASTVPPRSIVKVSFDDAWDLLSRICSCGRDAYLVLDYHGGSRLQNFLWSFQSRTPQPPAYIRCLLQSLILADMKVLNSLSIKQLLLDDLEEFSLPADIVVDKSNWDVEAPQDSRFQLAKHMDGFIRKAADAYIDIFRTLCMNRSRLRRMLCHLVLEWDSLQLEAENSDVTLREYTNEESIHHEGETLWSFPLSSWAYHHKLQQLEWILQMGFELNIYVPDELGGLYWYLHHLTQTRIMHLERTFTFTSRRLPDLPTTTDQTRAAYHHSLSFLEFALLEAHATSSFASALSSLYSFLAHVGLLPRPYSAAEYSTPQLRYALRMRPFGAISLPELPSYDQFIANVSVRPDPNASDAKLSAQTTSLLNVAERALKSARKDWEAVSKTSAEIARVQGCEEWWRAGVKNVLRSVIAASIGVTVAKRAVGRESFAEVKGKLRVKIGGGGEGKMGGLYHAWWVVPEISVEG